MIGPDMFDELGLSHTCDLVYVKAWEVDEVIRRVGRDGLLLIVSGTTQELDEMAEKYRLESNFI